MAFGSLALGEVRQSQAHLCTVYGRGKYPDEDGASLKHVPR